MPIRFKDLKDKVRKVVVEWDDDTLAVEYRPGASTVETAIALQEAIKDEDGSPTLAMVESFQEMVVSWDLLDEDDKPYPITTETLRKLPTYFLVEIMHAIAEDQNPTKRKSKRS